MSLTLPAGHHLVRLTALTPANCGDTGGSAAIDRPVAVDAWSGLPYLPHSALKGVLAGRRGNVRRNGALNRDRTDLFGAPDDDMAGGGKAGEVIFGDADALAFPVLLRDGRRAMVAVATTLWRLAQHEFLPAATLLRVEEESAYEGPVARSELPPLPEPLKTAHFGIDPKTLEPLLGFTHGPVIVAAPAAARALWQAAVEERTLTALGGDRTVRAGSLRTIELIPAGTLFVSLVSNLSGAAVDLGEPAPLQLGAWESTGLGYFQAAVIPVGGPEASGATPRDAEGSGPGPSPRHEVMREVYLAMKELATRKEAPRTRSAIFDLGPRLAQRGLAVTLAFCLAKAGGKEADGAEDRARSEQAAYRWLLRQLFGVAKGAPHADLHERVVAAIREGDSALPPDFQETSVWLRRYAETLLPKEKGSE